MEHPRENTVFWRRKPIDALDRDELRLALAEAVSMLLGDERNSASRETFLSGIWTGLAIGTVASLVALALYQILPG